MRANPLTEQFAVPRDRLGRLPVDDYLRVTGVPDVFAAGDVAAARMDDEHLSVMSCQHGRPMGRFAGYNVISDLLGAPMLALRIPWYVTVLDLGPGDAVYTEGWDRQVVATGRDREGHQDHHQHPAHLSAAVVVGHWRACGTAGRRGSAGADAARTGCYRKLRTSSPHAARMPRSGSCTTVSYRLITSVARWSVV